MRRLSGAQLKVRRRNLARKLRASALSMRSLIGRKGSPDNLERELKKFEKLHGMFVGTLETEGVRRLKKAR